VKHPPSRRLEQQVQSPSGTRSYSNMWVTGVLLAP
jgi:hypothetical protein